MKYLGIFGGFPTYSMSFKELDDNYHRRDLVFVNDFGEMVLNGKIIGKLNFKTGGVEEYAAPHSYKVMAERAKEMELKKAPELVEVKLPVDEVELESAMKDMVVCGIDLDKIVNEGLQVDCSPIG